MQTHIQDDPEFAVGPEPLAPRVVRVAAVGDRSVHVTFETGDARFFDVSPLFAKGVFRALRDVEAFRAVSVVAGGGGIEWASGPDLSAGRLYTGGTPTKSR